MDENAKLIAVGASAGGIEAFLKLAAGLDAEMPAAISLVLHISSSVPTMFAELVSRAGPFQACFAADGDRIQTGRIFIAPPDRHLVVAGGCFRLVSTPRENWTRPAIDPLFRSAAAYFRNRAIGVLLSGALDDGTDGFRAIKRCGGITVAQDPDEAAFSDIPRSAIDAGQVDHVASVAEIPALLSRLATAQVPAPLSVPDDLLREVKFLELWEGRFDYSEQEWRPTSYACPECGGPLWEKKDGTGPFGCTVGHRYGPQSLVRVQDAAVEQSLLAALRMLQERSRVLRRLGEDEMRRGNEVMAADYRMKAQESMQHVQRIRDFLLHIPGTPEEKPPGAGKN